MSSTEPVFWVLVSRRHVVHQDSTTLAYRIECFLSLPLDPLVTLLSSHFTRGKIASECDVAFERYRTNDFSGHFICILQAAYTGLLSESLLCNTCLKCDSQILTLSSLTLRSVYALYHRYTCTNSLCRHEA